MTVEYLEVLVEEASMESALRILLPKMLADGVTFQVYPSNGKQDLLENLPNRFWGYKPWLPQTWRIVVVVDRDNEDCSKLKHRLEQLAQQAGLTTKTIAGDAPWQIVNRIAIEELEAWFFGDLEAVRAVYPRIPGTLEQQVRFRDPDAISGGTWEALERVLQRAGYFAGGYRKLEGAREIAARMDPRRNRSHSFQIFRDTVMAFSGT